MTHKRLYGFTVLVFIIGWVGGFVWNLAKVNLKTNLSQQLALVFCVVLGIANLINFDYLIYRNPPRESTGIELDYVSAMNLDSYSLEQEYPKYLSQHSTQLINPKINSTINPICLNTNWTKINQLQIQYLQQKYSQFQLLSFNLAEYQNYQNIKNIQPIDPNLLIKATDYSYNPNNENYQTPTKPTADCYFKVYS